MTDRRDLATRIWLAVSRELGLTLTSKATLDAVIAAAENELPATRDEMTLDGQLLRLPEGWAWLIKKYHNLPWANNGYVELYSPHIDDLVIKKYDSSPVSALRNAINDALSEPTTESEVMLHSRDTGRNSSSDETSGPQQRADNTQPPPLDGVGERVDLELRAAALRGKLKLGWRSGNSSDDGDRLGAELAEIEARLASSEPSPGTATGERPTVQDAFNGRAPMPAPSNVPEAPDDALGMARLAVEAIPSRLFDRSNTEAIAQAIAPDFDDYAVVCEAARTREIVAWLRWAGWPGLADAIEREFGGPTDAQ